MTMWSWEKVLSESQPNAFTDDELSFFCKVSIVNSQVAPLIGDAPAEDYSTFKSVSVQMIL